MRKIVYLSLCCCLLAAVVSAETTDTLRSRQILVFPAVAKSIETSWSFGAAGSVTFHLLNSDTIARTSNVQALGLYSLKKQFITAVTGTQYFNKETYILYEQLSYSYFPDNFWGIGKNSPASANESYVFKQYYINLHLMRNLGHDFYLGLLYELQRVISVEYEKGGIFDQQRIAGRTPYLINGMGLSFTYDNRNNAFSPDKGIFAQVFFNHFDKFLGSKFVYTNYVIDLRKFVSVYEGQVLALQLFGFFNGGKVPLRSLASLGGNNSMRGYYDGRYRDKNQYTLQAEYRIPVYKRWGLAVFGSTGDVAHELSDFSIHTLKYAYGAGLRFAINRSEKLNLRLDYGIAGKANQGLYLQIGEAF